LYFFWPISEVATPVIEVGLVGHSGPDLLTLSFSRFDPEPSSPRQILPRCTTPLPATTVKASSPFWAAHSKLDLAQGETQGHVTL
jgi:hypothetical protein